MLPILCHFNDRLWIGGDMLQCSELLGVISIMFRTARCHLNIEIGDDPGAAIGGGRIAGLLVTE